MASIIFLGFPTIVLGKKERKRKKRNQKRKEEEASQNGKKPGLANAKYIL
jgi:hypothetical protein